MADVIQQLKALVVQYAATDKALGVDFIPVYHTGVLGIEIDEPGTQAPATLAEQPVAAAPASLPARAPSSQPQNPAGTVSRGTGLPSVPTQSPSTASLTAPSPGSTSPPMAKRTASKPAAAAPLIPALADVGQTSKAPPKPIKADWLPTVTGAVAAKRSRVEKEAAMKALRAKYEADAPHQHFKTDHHTIVWSDGDIDSHLMFVGEAPGEEEDKQGKPFVGRSGQLLDKMIKGMGLTRETIYIGNVLKTRPPNNATPTSFEIDLCSPYLLEQISIVSPKVIVTLGLPAVRALLRTDETMGNLRGRWSTLLLPDGREIPVMPTYHPAYVLRSYTEEVRGKVWSDLKMAMEKLGLAPPPPTTGAA